MIVSDALWCTRSVDVEARVCVSRRTGETAPDAGGGAWRVRFACSEVCVVTCTGVVGVVADTGTGAGFGTVVVDGTDDGGVDVTGEGVANASFEVEKGSGKSNSEARRATELTSDVNGFSVCVDAVLGRVLTWCTEDASSEEGKSAMLIRCVEPDVETPSKGAVDCASTCGFSCSCDDDIGDGTAGVCCGTNVLCPHVGSAMASGAD